MTVKFKLPNGTEKELMPVLEHYTVYDYMLKAKHGLAIVLFAQNEETGKYDVSYPFVTKSFGEFIGMKNSVYIDLNNCPFAVDLLKQGFAEDTGLTKHSGRCVYPLWTFKEEFLKEIGAENYKIYSDEFDHYMKDAFGDEDEEF